jgi:hypothetical protein
MTGQIIAAAPDKLRRQHRGGSTTKGQNERSIERLERGLALCAYLVALDGPVVLPLFRESGTRVGGDMPELN